MFKPIKSILFATNLSENCRAAFEMAATMATRHQATLVLLHVMEKISDYAEGRLKSLLGKEEYDTMVQKSTNDARQTLIAKKSSNKLVQEALEQFCSIAGIDNASCNYKSHEVVITDGDLVQEILSKAKEYNCALIVMGAREGFLVDNSIGHNIKSVMRHSKIPVMMVPPVQE